MRKITIKWLKQAEADLKAARDSLSDGNHEWSCFQSQQSGEKALKACLYEKGYTSIVTHSLKELLKECSKLDASFNKLSTDARPVLTLTLSNNFVNFKHIVLIVL